MRKSFGPVSLELAPANGGQSQAFLSPSGVVLLAADPSGDLMLLLGGEAVAAARYSSVADGTARLEREDLTVETAFREAADAPGLDVTTRLTAREPIAVLAFGHAYCFPPGAARSAGAPLDYAWIPSLKSRPGDVVGDHVFRSPCLVLRHAGVQVALVPHLDSLRGGPLRATMDLAVPETGGEYPRFSYALRDYKPHGHVYYAPTGTVAELAPGDTLQAGFTLLFETDAGPLAYQSVLRFLWRRYGEKNLTAAIAPQTLGFADYARLSFDSTIERYGLWRGFRLSGTEVGGISARIVRPGLDAGSEALPQDQTPNIASNYLFTRTMTPRNKASLIRWNARGIHPHIWNAVFNNNLRTSFGMMHYARRWRDAGLESRARAMWNLALAAPSRGGIFPSVFAGDERHPRWVPGTRIWKYTSAYHTPDAAVTGWWMLAIDRLLGGGGLFARRCVELGDFFLRAQQPSGAIPTWVKVGRNGAPRPEPVLKEIAGSAAAGVFLASLADDMGRDEYRKGACRVADFIIDKVFPRQAWLDTEVFFSCSRKPLDWKDPTTGIPPQGTFCMAWAAELLGILTESTKEPRYRVHGRAALDLILYFQQIWKAPYISMDTRGGFGVMNTDAEWSDARQALFAPLLLQWYSITGEAELFHRGVSALRSAFTLMLLEEHRQVAPRNTAPMETADRGALPENYGHAGMDAKIQGYVMPDWGGGTAVSAAALIELLWGDLYVDAARGEAFGVNGCRVVRAELHSDSYSLELERLSDAPLILKCSGVSAPRIRVAINGVSRGVFDRPLLERGVAL